VNITKNSHENGANDNKKRCEDIHASNFGSNQQVSKEKIENKCSGT
jgi:hypothetical protein